MDENKNVPAGTPEGAQPENKPTVTIEDLTKQVEALTAAMAKQKKSIDSASADAAEWKRKYFSTLDEATAAEEKRKEADAEKDARIAELEKREAVRASAAKFLEMGYTEELAQQSAEAFLAGDIEKLSEYQNKFLTDYETRVKTKLLNNQPSVTPGKTPTGVGVEDPRLTAFKRGAKGI